MIARRISLAAFLLPMKLSSTRKMTRAPSRCCAVDLGDDLLGLLDPRLPAEDDDDVAELALVRAAARGLDAAHRVFAEAGRGRTAAAGPWSCRSSRPARTARRARPAASPRGTSARSPPPRRRRSRRPGPSNQFSATLIQGPPTTVKMPRSASSTRISRIRSRWTVMPVRPTMSNDSSASKSISSMFSSISTTSCSGGVSPASTGKASTGMFARLPRMRKAVIEPPERDREARVDQADPCHGRGPSGWFGRFADWRRESRRRSRSDRRLEIATRYGTGSDRIIATNEYMTDLVTIQMAGSQISSAAGEAWSTDGDIIPAGEWPLS